jgi:hypothetical protein
MASNNMQVTPRTAVSLGLVIMLAGALVASAVAWGRMQAQLSEKLDCSAAERDFVRQSQLSRQLDSIDCRLTRMEDKMDRLLGEGKAPPK